MFFHFLSKHGIGNGIVLLYKYIANKQYHPNTTEITIQCNATIKNSHLYDYKSINDTIITAFISLSLLTSTRKKHWFMDN